MLVLTMFGVWQSDVKGNLMTSLGVTAEQCLFFSAHDYFKYLVYMLVW